jgi:hypothetical protein
MDDYMFKNHVDGCKNVVENTSYLEILNYSVGTSTSSGDAHASSNQRLTLAARTRH